ncbi:MAG TPA: nitroreductase family protein [Candidatus Ozemobacteraceae bacterium]|nr:nitroreductase family protein [Candidatus Ozemobacteraceae bacterium]
MTNDMDVFDAFSAPVIARRSVRQFRPDPVDPALIRRVLETVRYAPAPTNRHCFRFLAVSDQLLLQSMSQDVSRRIDEIAGRLDGESAAAFRDYSKWFTFFDRAPLVLFGAYRSFASRLPSGENDRTLEGLAEIQAFGGAVHALLIGLHAVGLGSCWMSGPLVAENPLERLLDLQKPWRLGAVIPVGWPAVRPKCPKKPSVEDILVWYPPKSSA